MSDDRTAWGRGLATTDANGVVLDAWYPELGLGTLPKSPIDVHRLAMRHDEVRGVDVGVVEVEVDLDAAPASAIDLYLRLHLLSNRLCQPRTVSVMSSTTGRLSPGSAMNQA